MKRAFVVVCLLAAPTIFAAVTSTAYNLPANQYTGLWASPGRDNHGNMYVGAGWYDFNYAIPQKNCRVFRYNFTADRWDAVGTVMEASEKYDNWVTYAEANYPAAPFDAAGKIHTRMTYYKGYMIFGTHATCDMPTFQEDLQTYPTFFRGGHAYGYDIEGDSIVDFNGPGKDVLAPGNGLLDVAPDYHHNGIFGIGYPTGQLFRHDLTTGQDTMCWQTPQGISNNNAGSITRNMIVDNLGRVYMVWSNHNQMSRYDFQTGQVSNIMFPLGQSTYSGHMRAIAHSQSRDSIYFILQDREKIYRLRVTAQAIDTITSSSGSLLALRWDQQKLYYFANSSGSTGLKCYDIATGAITTLTVGGAGLSGSGQTWYGNSEPIDKNGDIWLCAGGSNTGRILKLSMNMPCAICSTFVLDYGPDPNNALEDAAAAILADEAIVATPNPFNPETRIAVSQQLAAASAKGSIEIFNVYGKLVKTLPVSSSQLSAGVVWNAANQPSGIYVAKVSIGGKTLSKRLTLVK